MGSKPVKLKKIVKVRKSKAQFEKSFEKVKNHSENPNCELLLAYYASEQSMNKKIKALYEIIFAHEEQDIYEINLGYINFDVKCTYHLKIILHFFINIQGLKLSKVGLNSKNLKRISRSLPAFTRLMHLSIDGNRFDPQGITTLTFYFKYWKRLLSIDLSDNGLDPYCFEIIGNSLHHLKELQILKLNFNYSKDEGVISLKEGISLCTNLEILELASNSISYDGIRSLLDTSNSLKTINFSNNHISKELAFLLTSKYENIELIL